MFTTSKPLPVTLEHKAERDSDQAADGWRYYGGAFRSVIFPSETEAVKSIKKRFPAAIVNGRPVQEAYPDVVPDPVLPKCEEGEMIPLPGIGQNPAPPPARTTNPHVFVAGNDGYCILCDNKEPNPLHIPPQAAPPKRTKRTKETVEADRQTLVKAQAPRSVMDEGSLW